MKSQLCILMLLLLCFQSRAYIEKTTSRVMQLSRLILSYPSGSRFCFICQSNPHLSSFLPDSSMFAAALQSRPIKESGTRQFSSLVDITFCSITCKHLLTLKIAPERSQELYAWCFSSIANEEKRSPILLFKGRIP